MARTATLIALLSDLCLGCYVGVQADETASSSDGGDGAEGRGDELPPGREPDDGIDEPTPAGCEPPAPGLRRLSPRQFDNTVAALVANLTGAPSAGFIGSWVMPDALGDWTGVLGLPTPHTAQLQIVAEEIGAQVAADPGFVDGCLPANVADSACVRGFATELMRRGFRRAATEEEVDSYVAFFDAQRAAYDTDTAISMTVQRAILAPDFLFRTELGDGSSDTMLGAYERASALSYLIADGPPDEALYEAAKAGELMNSGVVAEHAARLLADRQSGGGVEHFLGEHLEYEHVLAVFKDGDLFPRFDAELAASMAQETKKFVAHVLWEGDATFATMLTADYSLVNDRLADLYGIPGEFDSNFVQTEVPVERRAGVLGHASFLAARASNEESSIVFRGLYITTELLCKAIPPPPPEVPDSIPEPDESMPTTQRERLEQHRADPSCAACHDDFDPLGYPFEAFDAIGAHRDVDAAGLSLDLSLELPVFIDPEQSALANVEELGAALANATPTYNCLADHLYNYTYGAPPRLKSCEYADLRAVANATDGSVIELVQTLVQSETFFRRTARED